MSPDFHLVHPHVTVIERGWLNCNQIVLTSRDENILIDSGYGRHAQATVAYVEDALQGKPLHRLINTHCHSDHMGGNRALREKYGCRITVPEGEIQHVVPWTAQSCWSAQMDQYAEEFQFDDSISADDTFAVSDLVWRAISAPGHDMGALMFWCESARMLITGDAFWERGLGFVWPSTAGDAPNSNIRAAFETFDAIERLKPITIIPGHGAPFHGVEESLAFNRSKLTALASDPIKRRATWRNRCSYFHCSINRPWRLLIWKPTLQACRFINNSTKRFCIWDSRQSLRCCKQNCLPPGRCRFARAN